MRLEVRVARRYAKALVEVLPKEKLEKVLEEAKTLDGFIDEKVVRYFKSPVVGVEKKKLLLEQIVEKLSLTDELRRVLLLMAEKDRLGLLKDFVSELEKLVDAKLGIVKAQIVSATELDDEVLKKIVKKIEELLNKKVEVTVELDPSLIGGFVVKVADKVIDASIKTQLENLRKAISE